MTRAGLALISLFVLTSCTPQQAKTADSIVVDLTNAVCTLAPDVDGDPAWVPFACTLVEYLESEAQPYVQQLTVRVPRSQAAEFQAAHVAKPEVRP
jgi:hypothetical protein